jgi:peroxiredoxin
MLLGRISVILLWLAALAPAAMASDIPRPSPDFAVNLNNGGQIHVSQYHGKVVVLAFILTSCPHCQFTSQILSGLQNEYGPRGFQVVASAIEDMASMFVPDFIKKFQPPYPVGYNERPPVLDYLQHPVIYRLMMPQVVMIDRKGVIRAQFAGDDKFFEKPVQEKNFRELLEPLLKEGEAAATHKKTAGKKKS